MDPDAGSVLQKPDWDPWSVLHEIDSNSTGSWTCIAKMDPDSDADQAHEFSCSFLTIYLLLRDYDVFNKLFVNNS